MNLQTRINDDLKAALRAKDALKTETLRMLLSSIKYAEIKKRKTDQEGSLDDNEIISVLQKEVKKRKEAHEAFKSGGREGAAKKEKDELDIIQQYLPEELSEEEIRTIVAKVIDKMELIGQQDFGKVMGLSMKEAGGRAQGNDVSRIVKDMLSTAN